MELSELKIKGIYALKGHQKFALVLARDSLYEYHNSRPSNVFDYTVTVTKVPETTYEVLGKGYVRGVIALVGTLEALEAIKKGVDAKALMGELTRERGYWNEGRLPYIDVYAYRVGDIEGVTLTAIDPEEIEGLARSVLSRSELNARKKAMSDAAMGQYLDQVESLNRLLSIHGFDRIVPSDTPRRTVEIDLGELETLLRRYEG